MAFTKMGDFTFNHAEQPDKLNLPAAETKAKLDSRANELKTAFNAAVDLLNATAAGDSGADNVGAAAIDGIEGASVQAQMVGMKGYVDAHKADTATETAKGHVELATAAETTTGTDDTRAVHPKGLKVELDKKLNLAGGTMTGALVVPKTNGGFRVDSALGMSFYDNEINSQGAGPIALGARNTEYVRIGSGAWNGCLLTLGGYYIWVDSSGRMRIKLGPPTSDTDGTVVGTQS